MMGCCKELCFVIDEGLTLDFEIGEVYQIDRDPYTGEYVVTPQTYEQYLYTRGLVMQDDVTVLEIPYAEVANIYGTTVTIAS